MKYMQPHDRAIELIKKYGVRAGQIARRREDRTNNQATARWYQQVLEEIFRIQMKVEVAKAVNSDDATKTDEYIEGLEQERDEAISLIRVAVADPFLGVQCRTKLERFLARLGGGAQ